MLRDAGILEWLVVLQPGDCGLWQSSYFYFHDQSLSLLADLRLQATAEDWRKDGLCTNRRNRKFIRRIHCGSTCVAARCGHFQLKAPTKQFNENKYWFLCVIATEISTKISRKYNLLAQPSKWSAIMNNSCRQPVKIHVFCSFIISYTFQPHKTTSSLTKTCVQDKFT